MSMMRACDIWKASNQKWYVTLGNFEYAYDESDCTVYGPFANKESAEKELDNHSNPGTICYDDNGTVAPPKKVVPPSRPFSSRRWLY